MNLERLRQRFFEGLTRYQSEPDFKSEAEVLEYYSKAQEREEAAGAKVQAEDTAEKPKKEKAAPKKKEKTEGSKKPKVKAHRGNKVDICTTKNTITIKVRPKKK
jgi:hypothetical protein